MSKLTKLLLAVSMVVLLVFSAMALPTGNAPSGGKPKPDISNNAGVDDQPGSYAEPTNATGDDPNYASAPEPSSIILIGLGLIGITVIIRKKRLATN